MKRLIIYSILVVLGCETQFLYSGKNNKKDTLADLQRRSKKIEEELKVSEEKLQEAKQRFMETFTIEEIKEIKAILIKALEIKRTQQKISSE